MGVLPTGKVGLLAAPGGTGKTFALTALAFSIALGRPWFGNGANTSWLNCPRRGRVVLLLGEDDTYDVQRRILTQARALGLCDSDRAGVNAQLLALGGQGQRFQLLCGEKENYAEHPVASGLYELLRQEALERGPFRAILLDPLSRFSPPEAETDNHAATRLVEVLERFAGSAELGRPLVMASHHTRKGNGEGADPADRIRGSSGLRDGVRWAALMTREEIHPLPHLVEGLVRIECVKSNVGAWPKALHLARVAGGALRGLSEEEQAVLGKNLDDTKRKSTGSEKQSSVGTPQKRIVGKGP
jgi:RecA-family ATPase